MVVFLFFFPRNHINTQGQITLWQVLVMPWPQAGGHPWQFTSSGSGSIAFGFGVSFCSTGQSVLSSDLVCCPTSQTPQGIISHNHARSCHYLGMKTEGASVNSKAVSSGEDRKGKTRLGWEAEFITLNNLSMTPGNRHQNKSFPSVVSLSLWLIPRKILETSWLVLWPQHLGCAEGWQIYFGIAPPCSGHWERHSRDFANEAAVIFHESLWSIHQLADPLIYGPSACLGVERT